MALLAPTIWTVRLAVDSVHCEDIERYTFGGVPMPWRISAARRRNVRAIFAAQATTTTASKQLER